MVTASLFILRLERSVFLKNFEKKIFYNIFISLEVPKFKANVLTCIIFVKKVRDLLLTLLQVITILAYV